MAIFGLCHYRIQRAISETKVHSSAYFNIHGFRYETDYQTLWNEWQ